MKLNNINNFLKMEQQELFFTDLEIGKNKVYTLDIYDFFHAPEKYITNKNAEYLIFNSYVHELKRMYFVNIPLKSFMRAWNLVFYIPNINPNNIINFRITMYRKNTKYLVIKSIQVI